MKSKLHDVVEQVNNITNFENKKAKTLELVRNLDVNNTDKAKMLSAIQYQCNNDRRLTQYLYNALLKFEGLGVI